MEYKGATAIVTGGGHGIGRALAEALAERGANVVVADIHLERAAKIAERIGGLAVRCDVGDPDSVNALVSAALRTFGPVDIAVSNAGMTDQGNDLDSSACQVRRIVDVNLLSHVWMGQAVLPSMIERGHGALIQTISSAALITGPSPMGYTLTKHGALGFAEWVAPTTPATASASCACAHAVNSGFLGATKTVSRAAPPRRIRRSPRYWARSSNGRTAPPVLSKRLTPGAFWRCLIPGSAIVHPQGR